MRSWRGEAGASGMRSDAVDHYHRYREDIALIARYGDAWFREAGGG